MAEQKRVENSLQLFDSFPRLLPVPADIPARKLLPSPFLHSRSSREEECLSNDGLARGKPSSRAICKNRSIPFVSSPCFCAPTNRTRSNLAGEGGSRVELGLKRVPCRRILVSAIHISLSICIKRRRSSSVIRVVNGRAGDGLGSQDSATNTKLDTLCRSECGTMLDNRGRERVEDRCSDRFRS